MHLIERAGTRAEQARGEQRHHGRNHHRAKRGQHQRAKQNLGDEQASGQWRMVGAGHPGGGTAGNPQFPF
jgi:hypothetical protein